MANKEAIFGSVNTLKATCKAGYTHHDVIVIKIKSLLDLQLNPTIWGLNDS